MPSSIIKRVEAMAIKEKQDKTITIHDRSGTPITDLYDSPNDETDEAAAGVRNGNKEAANEAEGITIEQHDNDTDYDGTVNGDITGTTETTNHGNDTGVTTDDGEVTGVSTEDGEVTGIHTETTGVVLNDDAPSEQHPGTPGVSREPTEHDNSDADDPPPLGSSTIGNDSDDEGNDADEENDGIETPHDDIPNEEVYHPDTMTPSIQRTYGLRPKRTRDYSHMFLHATIMHHAMRQYSLKKGLRKFQKVGEAAVSKELKQLNM
jgi:hypothetical protein